MPKIRLSLRTFVIMCLTVAAAAFFALSLVPREYGRRIIASWEGKPPGGNTYYQDCTGGGFINDKWWDEIQLLKSLGPLGVRLLCEALESQDAGQKLNVVMALREFGADASTAVPQLIPLLDVDDPELRQEVAGGLATIGPAAEPAIPKLQELLKSLSAHDESNQTTILLLKVALSSIRQPALAMADSDSARNQLQRHSQKRGWMQRLALVTGTNGWLVGLLLATFFGCLLIWSYCRDRRYFRQLREAKQETR